MLYTTRSGKLIHKKSIIYCIAATEIIFFAADIITNIMSNIMTLMSLGKTGEASRYQIMLNKLIKDGEVFELNNLLQSIKRDIDRYKDG